MVNIKPIDNKLALGLLIISSNAVNAVVLVEGGRMVSIMSNKFSCSPSIGIYGIRENKTIIEDLIVAAHNNAKILLKSKTSEEISKATGGLGIPGFKWPL